ncbi:MAG TPA: PHP-associated domain-containing protein [Actinoallomurus sp.]|nr:PHP-associated domain-containing protein [Actinoallomurus sp.]
MTARPAARWASTADRGYGSRPDGASELASRNSRTTRTGSGRAAGSDAHDPHGIGAAYLDMPDFDGPRDFIAALREGRIHGEFRDHAAYPP